MVTTMSTMSSSRPVHASRATDDHRRLLAREPLDGQHGDEHEDDEHDRERGGEPDLASGEREPVDLEARARSWSMPGPPPVEM